MRDDEDTLGRIDIHRDFAGGGKLLEGSVFERAISSGNGRQES